MVPAWVSVQVSTEPLLLTWVPSRPGWSGLQGFGVWAADWAVFSSHHTGKTFRINSWLGELFIRTKLYASVICCLSLDRVWILNWVLRELATVTLNAPQEIDRMLAFYFYYIRYLYMRKSRELPVKSKEHGLLFTGSHLLTDVLNISALVSSICWINCCLMRMLLRFPSIYSFNLHHSVFSLLLGKDSQMAGHDLL